MIVLAGIVTIYSNSIAGGGEIGSILAGTVLVVVVVASLASTVLGLEGLDGDVDAALVSPKHSLASRPTRASVSSCIVIPVRFCTVEGVYKLL